MSNQRLTGYWYALLFLGSLLLVSAGASNAEAAQVVDLRRDAVVVVEVVGVFSNKPLMWAGEELLDRLFFGLTPVRRGVHQLRNERKMGSA